MTGMKYPGIKVSSKQWDANSPPTGPVSSASACSAAYLSSHRFNELDLKLGRFGDNTKDIISISLVSISGIEVDRDEDSGVLLGLK